MSLDARRSLLWTRLQARFNSRARLVEETPNVSETIIPISSADDLLKNPRFVSGSFNIAAANAVIYTTPSGKRALLTFVFRTATVGSGGGILVATDPTISTYAYIAAQTASSVVVAPRVILTEGQVVILTATGNGADNAIVASVFIEEEDMY